MALTEKLASGEVILLAGNSHADGQIKPVKPVDDPTKLAVRAQARLMFERLQTTNMTSQCTYSIFDETGALAAEYALTGPPQFDFEPGSIDCLAVPYIDANQADIQVMEGSLTEAQVRRYLCDAPAGYTFSSEVRPMGLVLCSEEFCVGLRQLDLCADSYWLTLTDLSGYNDSVESLDLTLPTLLDSFEELTAEVRKLLEA